MYRSFISRDLHLLFRAFATSVRPVLEFTYVIWSPYYKVDIQCIAKVQTLFTEWLPGFRSFIYDQSLKRVILPPILELRRLHADLVVYKMELA